MTVLEAVGDYLAANGHGTLGTSLFLAVMPPEPDVVTCVYESPGYAPIETMGSAPWAVDRAGLQVICRGAQGDYPTVRDRAVAIRTLLAGVTDVTLSGVKVLRITPSGGVMPMGEDGSGRTMVSVNFDAMVLP